MRKLPAAAQEERRRQVIGLRQRGLTYEAIAGQAALSRAGVNRHLPALRRRGGEAPGQQAARAQAGGAAAAGRGAGGRGAGADLPPHAGRAGPAVRALEPGGAAEGSMDVVHGRAAEGAVGLLIARRCGVGLAVRTVGKYLARWGFTAQRPIRRAHEQALRCPSTRFARGTFGSSARRRCGAGGGGSVRPSWRGPGGPRA
jgi:hypothetical protein